MEIIRNDKLIIDESVFFHVVENFPPVILPIEIKTTQEHELARRVEDSKGFRIVSHPIIAKKSFDPEMEMNMPESL